MPPSPIASELLLMFLQLHDEHSKVPTDAWSYFTISDLSKLVILSKQIRSRLQQIEYNQCSNTPYNYSVPFPGFPGLTLRPIHLLDQVQGATGGLFKHQLASLQAMQNAENNTTAFGALRGGILGDAPGLGKTITLLALACSTAGRRPVPPTEFWDHPTIQRNWELSRTNPESRSEILKCLKPLRIWMLSPLQPTRQLSTFYKNLADHVQPPYSNNQFPTIDSLATFVLNVCRTFVPLSELELFRQNIVNLKAKMEGRRGMLHSTQGRRLALERSLIPASATLIIVPDALLEHWLHQINQNINLATFADRKENANNQQIPRHVIHLDGLGDIADVADSESPFRNVTLKKPLQPWWLLSKYFIVVTTFARCQQEYRYIMRKRRSGSDNTTTPGSELLRMRWLRLVVDEGHELGTHETTNDVTNFINEIAAERRWVMSGTPTTGDVDDKNYTAKALDQLQRLLFFLRHPQYGTPPSVINEEPRSPYLEQTRLVPTQEMLEAERIKSARQKWITEVKNPFVKRNIQGRVRLLQVLKAIMVMHRKEDIELPKPHFIQSEVNIMVPQLKQEELERGAVSDSQLSTMLEGYLHSTEFQILVDQSQADHIMNSIRAAQADRSRDQRPVKVVVYSSVNHNLLSVIEPMIRKLGKEQIAELYDTAAIGDTSTELNRFRHGVKQHKICPICKRSIEISTTNSGNRCDNFLMEVVSLADENKRFLIEPERIRRTPNVSLDRLEGEDMQHYAKLSKFWKVGDELEIDARDDHPLYGERLSEERWETYGSKDCKELAMEDNYLGRDWYLGPFQCDPKKQRMKCRLVKWQTCSNFHNRSRWYKGPTPANVPLQQMKEDCHILALHSGLSHGLDLSFVTHMFLLEPIDDAAVLEQVTSRAHRLGTTGPVIVDTVNPFFDLKKEIQDRCNKAESVKVLQNKTKLLSKVVCQYCFRQFQSMSRAEEHENTNCPRNPNLSYAGDDFQLSSVYHEIKPPPSKLAVNGAE